MREGAGDRPQVPHDRVGDERSGVTERAVLPRQNLRLLTRLVADERPDRESAAGVNKLVQPADPVDVHQCPRRREAELHHRDEAHAAGEHLRLALVVAPEDLERFVERVRREILETRGIHG